MVAYSLYFVCIGRAVGTKNSSTPPSVIGNTRPPPAPHSALTNTSEEDDDLFNSLHISNLKHLDFGPEYEDSLHDQDEISETSHSPHIQNANSTQTRLRAMPRLGYDPSEEAFMDRFGYLQTDK